MHFIIWCKACQHQVEPDAAEQADHYGAEMIVPKWHERLVCAKAAETSTWS
jgi:hypothetical protein